LYQSFLTAYYSTSYGGIGLTAGLSHRKPSGDLRWGYFGHEENAPIETDDPDGGRLSGRVYLFEPTTKMSIMAEWPEGTGFCRGEIRFREDDQTEYLGSIGVRPHRFLYAEFEHGRVYPFPAFSELYYAPFAADGIIGHEGGKVLWKMPASQYQIKLAASYYDKFEVTFRNLDMRLLTELPQFGDYPLGTYTGQVYGGWLYNDAGVSLKIYENWRGRVRFQELSLNCDSLTAHDGGLKFAHFGVVEGNGHIWSCRIMYEDYVVEIQRGRAEGWAKGTVQAWPFLQGLYHFIGERRHFIVDAKIRWLQTSLKSGLYNGSWINLDGCLSYLRVKPDMSYITWRPYFFGMGVDDLRAGSLDLERADLVLVQLLPQVTWSNIKISLDISQWVPLYSRTISDSQTDDNNDGEGGVSEDKQSVWGGFTALLVITAAF
jgi:hypothetical protein